MWNDKRRYFSQKLETSPVFPRPENYTNLDNFLHDIRLAIRDEKHFRRQHHLISSSARYEYNLSQQAEVYFDVI